MGRRVGDAVRCAAHQCLGPKSLDPPEERKAPVLKYCKSRSMAGMKSPPPPKSNTSEVWTMNSCRVCAAAETASVAAVLNATTHTKYKGHFNNDKYYRWSVQDPDQCLPHEIVARASWGFLHLLFRCTGHQDAAFPTPGGTLYRPVPWNTVAFRSWTVQTGPSRCLHPPPLNQNNCLGPRSPPSGDAALGEGSLPLRHCLLEPNVPKPLKARGTGRGHNAFHSAMPA